MKSVSMTLHGACADAMVREIAERFARMTIRAALPHDTVNAPWRPTEGETRLAAHRRYIAECDRKRADYRKSLLSVLDELPDVPMPAWRPYTDQRNYTYSTHYVSSREGEAVRAFAEAIILNLGKEQSGNG